MGKGWGGRDGPILASEYSLLNKIDLCLRVFNLASVPVPRLYTFDLCEMFSLFMRYQAARTAELDDRTVYEELQKREEKALQYKDTCEYRLMGSIDPIGSPEHVALVKDMDHAEAEVASLRLQVLFARRAWHHALDEMYWLRNINSWDEYMDNGGLREIPEKWTRVA